MSRIHGFGDTAVSSTNKDYDPYLDARRIHLMHEPKRSIPATTNMVRDLGKLSSVYSHTAEILSITNPTCNVFSFQNLIIFIACGGISTLKFAELFTNIISLS